MEIMPRIYRIRRRIKASKPDADSFARGRSRRVAVQFLNGQGNDFISDIR